MAIKDRSVAVLQEHSNKLKRDKTQLSIQLGEIINKISLLETERARVQSLIDEANGAVLDIDKDIDDARGLRG